MNKQGASKKSRRIGIYSGVFDPIHKGHSAFAKHAIDTVSLDKVYIALEAKPQRKSGVTHIGHRTHMVRLAIRHDPKLQVLELPDAYFLPAKTIPSIRRHFPNDQLVLLLGSDLLFTMHQWPRVELLLREMGLAVAVRDEHELAEVLDYISMLPAAPREIHIVENDYPHVSSRHIRAHIQQGKTTNHVVPSVHAYAKKEWLYDSIQ